MDNQPKYLVIEKGEETMEGTNCIIREFTNIYEAYDFWIKGMGKRKICKEIELEVVEKI